jgi:glucokinase
MTLHSVSRLPEGPPVIAFDVGGTDIKSAIIAADGSILDLRRSPAPASGADAGERLLDELVRLGAAHAERVPSEVPVAVGLAVPGLVDEASGRTIRSVNLGWQAVDLLTPARERFGLPVAFSHDVRAAGLAEHRLGAARGFDDAVVVTVGTGIGAAIILGGTLYRGGGLAGEIGHTLVRPGGEVCTCGARGCLESVASASSIARRYNSRAGTTLAGAQEVLDLARTGDTLAAGVWTDAVEALAEALVQVTSLLAPEVIVIGGGLSRAGDELLGPLNTALNRLLHVQRAPALRAAELGGEAGLIGTALAARDLTDAGGSA